MLADPEEVECSRGKIHVVILNSILDDIEKNLRERLCWQTGDGDVCILGIFQLINFSKVKIYLFLKGFNGVFAWSVEAVKPDL